MPKPDPTVRELARDPVLLPFLPMLYVAWADGDLDPSEVEHICTRLGDITTDAPCRSMLRSWLDPQNPPDAASLQALLSAIRSRAAQLDPAARRTLSQLGLELAEQSGHVIGEAEKRALEELETSLSIVSAEASRSILRAERPDARDARRRAAFPVKAMTELLEAPHREIRSSLKRLLAHQEFSYPRDLDSATYRELVLSWTRELAARGFGSLAFPAEYGGAGDAGAMVAAFETLAFHDLSLTVKFGVQFGLFGGSVLQLGTRKHHERYLRDIGRLELPGCFAMTETGHGSNVQDLETEARFDDDTAGFILHTPGDAARKDYIGNAAAHGQMATVFAQLVIGEDRFGVHAFLVPIRDSNGDVLPGVRIADCGEKLGLNGVDNGRLWFDQVRIPRENLLDRFASVDEHGAYTSPITSPNRRFFTMLGTLVGGRVSVAAAAGSVAKSALTIATRYASRRRQFGPAGEAETELLDYLTHQRRLLPRLATTYALHFALRHLAKAYVESSDDNRRELETLAAGLKAYSTWHTTDTVQECRELCGGQGYLAENRFAALKADSDVFTTFEGDNIVLYQLVAKALLSGYKQEFGEMSLMKAVRFLASQAATVVTELNPVTTRNESPSHLRSSDFQLASLRWRRDHLLASLARRLKKRLDDGMDSFEALVEVQDHAVSTARAHVESLVLESFVAAIETATAPLQEPLERLRELFALSRIEDDRGWFQEHGYLEAGKSKAIRKEVNRLCRELQPHAVALVDSFAIPDELIAAPIGRSRNR